MDKIRTAVVGAGKMGTIHAKVYDQLPINMDVVPLLIVRMSWAGLTPLALPQVKVRG